MSCVCLAFGTTCFLKAVDWLHRWGSLEGFVRPQDFESGANYSADIASGGENHPFRAQDAVSAALAAIKVL